MSYSTISTVQQPSRNLHTPLTCRNIVVQRLTSYSGINCLALRRSATMIGYNSLSKMACFEARKILLQMNYSYQPSDIEFNFTFEQNLIFVMLVHIY